MAAAPRAPIPSYPILGVTVNAIDVETLFALMESIIRSGRKHVIANHNLHSIYLYHHDPKMRRFYELASYTFVDGTPLVHWGRLLGHQLSYRHRISSIHWIRPLLARGVTEGWRTYLLGGKPGTAARAAAILGADVAGAQIETHHGYFEMRPGHPEAEAVLEDIARCRPHILCLGMGMPRQEHWILEHFPRIEANVILNLGGFMELITGELPMPPSWAAPAGVEWLYRLATRPGRVWRRYLVEPWFLLPWLLGDLRRQLGPR